MSAIYHTKGIVIKKIDYGEYNHLYTVYTEDFGKVCAVCRGSKKIASKLSGHLEDFAIANLVLVRGKNNFSIIGSSLEIRYPNILTDFSKVCYISFCYELLGYFIKEYEKDVRIYKLITEILEIIDRSPANKDYLEMLMYLFGYQLLNILGFGLQLFSCVKCNTKLSDNNFSFSIHEGGLICKKCEELSYNKLNNEADKDVVKFLRLFTSLKISHLKEISVSAIQNKKILNILRELLSYHLERRVKSEKMLQYI